MNLPMREMDMMGKKTNARKLRPKALLIDLDGTLVDSTEAYKEAGRAGFIALGLNYDDDKIAFEVARRLEQNLPIDDLFAVFNGVSEVEERFLPAYLEAYYSVVHIKSRLFPRAKETLRTLSEDYLLALVTLRYATREHVIEELTRRRVLKYFRAVVTALDVKKPKPFPCAFLAAAESLGVKVQECVVVGDSVVDIQAGKAAGANTIAVLSGLFTRDELARQNPDAIIKNIGSLPERLTRLDS